MKSLFYIHFNDKELKERLKPLKELGVKLMGHSSTTDTAKLGTSLPDIFVVSLDRLPSHGRQYVQWLWEAKKRQHIPVIFVDGKPEKVEETKAKFPNAVYCRGEQLPEIVKGLL